jgi:hypothetical protein
MAERIFWQDDYDGSLTVARGEKKPVLLDFFNPG